MKVIVAGGTGFLGRPLCQSLAAHGHDVVVLTRGGGAPTGTRGVPWTLDSRDANWTRDIDDADVIISLAGESIADGRWTPARKEALRESRIASTRALVMAVAAARPRPRVFIGGSAVGFYGSTGDRVVDERSRAGTDFLAQLCVEWEREAAAAAGSGCRVVAVRTGIALARGGGALKKMTLPFMLFVGGPIASGRQYMSWIHRDDWVRMVEWAIGRDDLAGPLNATSPEPVTNEQFSRALGRALGRPNWLRTPALALRLALGEMADVALVHGQRVMPARALDAGFSFQYPTLDAALEKEAGNIYRQ